MSYNRAAVVDACIKKREQGMDYTQLRKELQNAGIDEDEIKTVIRLVDSHDRQMLFKKASTSQGNELLGAGAFLLAIGLFVTIGLSNSRIVILAYGAIISGASLMAAGIAKKRK